MAKGDKMAVGTRHGLWEVLEIVPGDRRPNRRCLCHGCRIEHVLTWSTLNKSRGCRRCRGWILARNRYLGKRFGKLIVTAILKAVDGRHRMCHVECDCGATRSLQIRYLTGGHSTHCGCSDKHTGQPMGGHHELHGQSGTPEYHAFMSMLSRCYSPKSSAWFTHGARGIRVCDRWLPDRHGGSMTMTEALENFLADMGDRPKGMTLDRKDNEGHYSPENCRWATPRAQANNRRNTLQLTIRGTTKTFSEWSKGSGIGTSLIRHRLMNGWPAERALDPVGRSGSRHMNRQRLWRGKRPIDDHPAVSRLG